MKLRIRRNSLRLRLQQSEVRTLADRGAVIDETCFGAATLRCSIERDAGITAMRADLEPNFVRIRVPETQALRWTSTEEVGMLAEQSTPAGPLVILVEKDFQCLQPRDPALLEDDSDAYPNPNPACAP
jgi:hypothetical protein